jgi:chemotaxis protein CheD
MKDWLEADAVGMGEFSIVAGKGRLSVRGLGSCVAVILHDPTTRIGGIAHVMLPSHTLARNQEKPAKFADTAVPLLVGKLLHLGVVRESVLVRLVGGARMFETVALSGTVHMGERNVVACRSAIQDAGLVVGGEDVGGQSGRSVLFNVVDGTVAVRTLGGPERHV